METTGLKMTPEVETCCQIKEIARTAVLTAAISLAIKLLFTMCHIHVYCSLQHENIA
jgi:hypothetical protein